MLHKVSACGDRMWHRTV